MALPRIYSPRSLEEATACELGSDSLRYLKTVLRLGPGDAVVVFDGFGHSYEALIESYTSRAVNLTLQAALPQRKRQVSVTLAQAVPKGTKMDMIVKGAAELGADVIIPYMASRSVSRPAGDKVPVKVDRWQKIATEASRCTGSALVTRVGSLLSFEEMLSLAEPSWRKMIFWEEEEHITIRDALNDPAFDVVGGYFVVVGPEGGLSRDEVAKASEAGFTPVTLGSQILKVETAAMAILAIIQYEKGIFSQYTERGAR